VNLNHDHEGHRARLKQRFLKEGNFDHFEAHNILEYLLFNTIPIRDTNDTAHRLLNHFGTLSAVFDAPYSELIKVEGVGPHTATLIKAVLPMARAYSRDKDRLGIVLDETEKVVDFLSAKYVGYNDEVFSVICLDNCCKVLSYDVIARGNVDMVHMDTRKLMEILIHTNATCAIIAHNHPGGTAIPSAGDQKATKTVGLSCSSINVKLLDHIILTDNDAVSMRESGLMQEDYRQL